MIMAQNLEHNQQGQYVAYFGGPGRACYKVGSGLVGGVEV